MFFQPKFDIDAKQAQQNLDTKDIFLLDVRTQEEYAQGHLPHAVLIPVDELEKRKDAIPSQKPIYLYCRSGQRANAAKRKLIAMGYTQVYNIGGVVQWPYPLTQK